MSDQSQIHARTRVAGQVVFVIGTLVLTLILLSQIGSQTRWVEGTKWAAQPRLWPGIGMVTMAVFLGMHLIRMKRRRPDRLDWREARLWLRPLEYVVWFMGYVWSVPIIGFLPASVIFAPLLTWRVGYRSRGMLLIAALFGAATVVIFKSLLSVKIPGGLIYEYLPDTLRSFAILNL